MFQGIDLCSDTATKPSQGMRNAMLKAIVGDEQKGEDPTTRQLEEMVAHLLGFDAALFLPSATMANEIAIWSLCEPGDELLVAQNAHIFVAETGGPAVHGRVMCKPIPTESGIFAPDDVKRCYPWSKNLNRPLPKLISIENTTNRGGGLAWSQEELNAIVNCASELGLKTHMDGTRLFNASIKTGLSPKAIATGMDMVTLCLTKGLGCPVGALLVFNQAYYPKVRRLKQLMGGAMRQSGILAAAGIYALNHHVDRLADDHQNAAFLAEAFSKNNAHINVTNNPPATNMVYFEWVSHRLTAHQFYEGCLQKRLRFAQVGENTFRAVTHLDIQLKDVQTAVKIVKGICLENN
jgi:threonine aldolase